MYTAGQTCMGPKKATLAPCFIYKWNRLEEVTPSSVEARHHVGVLSDETDPETPSSIENLYRQKVENPAIIYDSAVPSIRPAPER